MFNCASCLTRQTLWLWFLLQYESMSKPCMTNAQSGYNDLFSSRCSKSWSPFSQGGLNLEEFIIDVYVPSLLPFLNSPKQKLHVFTDGSKDHSRTACAAVLNRIIHKKALPMESSIFTAEVCAIDLAFNIISRDKQQIYHIL